MKKRICLNIIIYVIFLLFLETQGFAINTNIEEGSVLTIEQCVDIALKNSPQINIYENKKRISKSRIGQAKSDFAPTFGVGSGYYNQSSNGGNVSNNDSYYAVDLSLRQLIYDFGKTGAKIKMQKFNFEASEYDLENIIIATTYDVKTAYYGVLAAKSSRDVSMQNVNINEREYERTKAFFDEGLKSKIDLVNAEVNLSEARIQLVNAENAYQNALIKLNNTMFVANAPVYSIANTETFNISNQIAIDLSNITKENSEENLQEPNSTTKYTAVVEKKDIIEDYKFVPFDLTLDDAVEKAYKNRPDVKGLKSLVKAMDESLKYTKREYMPELSAKLGYTLRNTNYYVNNGFNVAAMFDIATINPFKTKFNIDEAKAQRDLAQDNLDLLTQNVYFEVQSAYVNMVQIEKRIPLLATKVRQTLENYELADGRYEVGIGNFLELQDAKANYNSAQQSYVAAVFEYNKTRVQVEKAMGGK